MDAIKKKMQAMKLEKDNALDRALLCEQQARDANLRAEKAEEEARQLQKKIQAIENDLDQTQEALMAVNAKLEEKEKALQNELCSLVILTAATAKTTPIRDVADSDRGRQRGCCASQPASDRYTSESRKID
ncbi:hypothetical protein RP20_CCG008224 [Aedes albopictus]|nr:hypothetical protein RP20_CCG008224 [Aedes albopictus]